MPRLEFERFDTALVIAPAGRGRVLISSPSWRTELAAPFGPLPEATRQRLCPSPQVPAAARSDVDPIRRLTLDIRSPALHVHPWEDWLPPARAGFDCVVRLSPVPARVAQATFTPPLRVALVGHAAHGPALEQIRALFGARDAQRDARVDRAYAGTAFDWSALQGGGAAPAGWPVVDVLHLAELPLAATPTAQLSADAEWPGSLGWLARLLHGWQTRLLIIDVAGPSQARLARRLAAALVARAGPALLLRSATQPILPLYDRLIHDMALDAFSSPRSQYASPQLPRIDTLFLGGGREELVRVSSTAVALESLQQDLAATRIHFMKPSGLRGTPKPVRPEPMVRDLGASRRSERALADVVGEYRGWRFNFRESEGLMPMADALAAAADATAPLVRASRARTRRVNARYVNASLWSPGPNGRERVAAEYDRLTVGRAYEFGLQVGARDRLIPVYEASPFLEIPRAPGQAGVWLEVAVNGVGFDVEGSAVQDLWLPYGEPSDQLWFAVRPTRTGVAVLRYTLYHRQNVVQSYRLAAHTRHPDDDDFDAPDPRDGQLLLAGALHADPRKMPRDATYVTRLEYEAAPLAEAARLPERRLSIVANQVGSERVVTVKGRSFFLENKPGADSSLSELARNELFEVSVNKLSPARMDWLSRFGSNRGVNAAQLRAVLPRLALAGWRMYQAMFDADMRDQMQPELAGTDAQICVAHAMLGEVVPWALMYDRPYTAKPVPGGRLEVCTAALPAADGTLAVHECGQSPNCVLHQGLAEKNVACPLRFWGFRHQIEVPPRQTEGAPAAAPGVAAAAAARSAAAAPVAPVAPAAGALRLAAVINVGLATAAAHEQQLRTMQLSGPRGVVWQQIETHPDRLVEALDDADLDLVYLYCHARGGLGDPEKTIPPMLEFGDAAGTWRYAADELVVRWRRQPLVIINGCSTAAFSPDALSPFVRTFTRDCDAGGVIGTEIPVHEDLAREFAASLIRRVLEGEPVGRALLAVRRELLAGDNPLGLAYTLFAFSELTLGK